MPTVMTGLIVLLFSWVMMMCNVKNEMPSTIVEIAITLTGIALIIRGFNE